MMTDSITSATHPLRRYRATHGLTQEQLAKRLNVSSVAVSRWETGDRTPRGRHLRSLVEETGIPIDEIIRAATPIGSAAQCS